RMRKEEAIEARAEAPAPTPEPAGANEEEAAVEQMRAEETAADTVPTYTNVTDEPAPHFDGSGTLVVTGDAAATVEEERYPVAEAPLAETLATGGAYTVSRGETLSELAFAAGDGQKMTPQLVVALWKANRDAFIRGNLHGVRAGATLSFAGVAEEAARLRRAEAARIIRSQWDEWTARAGGAPSVVAAAPAVTAPIPAEPVAPVAQAEPEEAETVVAPAATPEPLAGRIPIRSAALSIITSWRDKGKDEGLDLTRASMGERAGDQLEVTAPKADDPDTSVTLILKRNADGTLTVTDRIETKNDATTPDDPRAARRFVVQVASFKEEEPARALVALLRRKGFDAYESGAKMAGQGEWYRVVVGRFGDREAGFAFARSLRARTGLSYTRLLDLPYAVQIGLPMDAPTALATVERLEGDGFIGAYTLPEKGKEGLLTVAVGAYPTPEAAKAAMTMMKEKGYDASQAIP
ncbi:MAG: SPOR domain-containing protein, partial [Nitrospinae bacterium]|nr:SPOR domain-containing protein [Nitrospinota bacterium]